MTPRLLAMIPLNDAVALHLTLHRHGGADFIDLRRCVDRAGAGHELVETQRGITVPLDALDDLLAALLAAKAALARDEAA